MTPAALITFAIVAGIVWGGFLLIAATALRAEANKEQD